MHNRMRWLMGATALLYIGPLLAGLGGYGWPLGAGLHSCCFCSGNSFCARNTGRASSTTGRSIRHGPPCASNAAIQLLFVALLFGVGRGIGGALGFVPPYSEMLPSRFLSCRSLWHA